MLAFDKFINIAMQRKYIHALIAGLLAGSFSLAYAGPVINKKNPVIEKQVPAPIAAMLSKGKNIKVIDSFKVEGTDLTAWMIVANGERRIFYVPPAGNVAILGLVFDSNLVNLTDSHAKKESSGSGLTPAMKPQVSNVPSGFFSDSMSQMTLGQLAIADASHVEGSGRDVYVIYDPACRFCHQFWRDTRGSLNKIRIHWIPVAKISGQSAGLADAIIGAVNPTAALAAASEGRLAPSSSVSQRSQLMLNKNALILEASGKTKVPYIAFAEKGAAMGYLGAPNAAAMSVILGRN